MLVELSFVSVFSKYPHATRKCDETNLAILSTITWRLGKISFKIHVMTSLYFGVFATCPKSYVAHNNKSYVGDNISYVGLIISYVGHNISYVGDNKSYVGDIITYVGLIIMSYVGLTKT